MGAAVGVATGAAVVPSSHGLPYSVQASSHLLRNLLLAHWPLDTRDAHQPSPRLLVQANTSRQSTCSTSSHDSKLLASTVNLQTTGEDSTIEARRVRSD